MILGSTLVPLGTGSTWLEVSQAKRFARDLVTCEDVPAIQKNSPPSGPHVYMKEMMGNAQLGLGSECPTQSPTPS